MKKIVCYLSHLISILMLSLSACNPVQQPVEQGINLQASYPETLVTFHVTLPSALAVGESISLSILDEVTGLAFNQQTHLLQAEDTLHYAVTLPIRIGSILKYRYTRQGSYMVQEHQTNGLPVRYRLHHVTGQALINDAISRWTDTSYTNPTGRIIGRVTDQQSGQPIAGLLVAAGGIQSSTAANGDYLIDGLIPGMHNLVIYAQDGSYQTFQQGASILPGATTPANVSLLPTLVVNVTFIVSLPENTPPDAPLRFAGNFIQLGNTFADLAGGMNTLASRMPVLSSLENGKRSITLSLPVGADLRYKYTLGDGIWNAEHSTQGSFQLRQIIIPAYDITIEDKVESWSAAGPSPVRFLAQVPEATPADEKLSIQFNPGLGWMEAIPMWPGEEKLWTFTLFSPLQGLDNIQYRYCRNEQCGSTDEMGFAGAIATGRTVNLSYSFQEQTDTITEWQWLPAQALPATVPNLAVSARAPGFIAGVSLQPAFHPSWMPHMPEAIRYVQQMNANWVIIAPTWGVNNQGNPVIIPEARDDIPWHDLISTAQLARQAGLNIGLFPSLRFSESPDDWWKESILDFPWWVTWFDRYRAFALHHAQVASKIGAGVLILGEQDILPSVPGNPKSAPDASNLPLDAENWWRQLFVDIRSIYAGPIAWSISFPDGLQNPPPFLDSVDFIYLEWDVPLSPTTNLDEAQMYTTAANFLDQNVLPFLQEHQKAVVLALAYPSAEGALVGCLTVTENTCLDNRFLARPYQDFTQISLDLAEQESAYNAILQAVNERSWIGGVVSQDFYPPAMLQDKSISVHGKPTAGILWYWYGRFLGK